MRRLLLAGLIAAAAAAWTPQRAEAAWFPQRYYVVTRKETIEDATRRVERVVAIALAVGLGVCALIAVAHFIRDTLLAIEAAKHTRQPWDTDE